ncbi:PREDICTED: endogenous retrovirus group FC1 Env polyprotein-like [Rhinopithecus bieti]|uniref:endogenous retrovirus group FC1 Env polyprotein-like n=1 Tax=Rhinopithecus bieti TaxID=61621 RepID=UPI00083BC63F|nr:PREDICTED: endogenous retrovirus group FC1 Env polyprotein-like [Rhinopithecus bieti]
MIPIGPLRLLTLPSYNSRAQVAIEAFAESLASLQWQITSVTQVATQNHRALNLLTADKGGTCMFLNEECCCYINESGLVETNLLTLEKIRKGLHQRNFGLGPSFGWWQSSIAGWVLPFLSPLLVIGFLLLIAPCVLHFIQDHIKEVSQVTVSQMLLHPYTRVPTSEEPHNDLYQQEAAR